MHFSHTYKYLINKNKLHLCRKGTEYRCFTLISSVTTTNKTIQIYISLVIQLTVVILNLNF